MHVSAVEVGWTPSRRTAPSCAGTPPRKQSPQCTEQMDQNTNQSYPQRKTGRAGAGILRGDLSDTKRKYYPFFEGSSHDHGQLARWSAEIERFPRRARSKKRGSFSALLGADWQLKGPVRSTCPHPFWGALLSCRFKLPLGLKGGL